VERYLFMPTNIEDWHWTSCYVQVGPPIRDPKLVVENSTRRMQYGDSYGHRDEQESHKPKDLEMKVSLDLTVALNYVVSPTVDLLHVPMQKEVECASRVIENAASMARELHLTSNLGRCTSPTRARLSGLVSAVDVDELAACRTSWRLRIRQAATLLGLLRVLSPAHAEIGRRKFQRAVALLHVLRQRSRRIRETLRWAA
jgi:hypothetical protein